MSLSSITFWILLGLAFTCLNAQSSSESESEGESTSDNLGDVFNVQSSGVLNITKSDNVGNMRIAAAYNLTRAVIGTCPVVEGLQDLSTQQILQRLTEPCRYYRLQRPPCTIDGQTDCPVDVTARVTISSMGIVQKESLNLKLTALLQLKYLDSRLAFSRYAPQISKPVLVQASIAKRLWLPLLTLSNHLNVVTSAAQNLPDNQIVYIAPNGTVWIATSFQTTVSCVVGYQSFPLDEQICQATIKSWVYAASDVELGWSDDDPLAVYPATNLSPYSLTDYWSSQALLSAMAEAYSNLTESYSTLSISLRLSRDLSISIVTYFIPSMMIVANSWIAFWLQPDQTPARATFGTSTLLSFVTLSITQQSNVPNPFYRKMTSIWFICCFLFIFGSLMEFAFVNVVWRRTRVVILRRLNLKHMFKLTSRPRINKPLPVAHDCEYCTKYLAGVESRRRKSTTTPSTVATIESDLTTNFGETPVKQEDCACGTGRQDDGDIVVVMSPHEAGLWLDRKARFLFPFFFVLFNAIFWALVLCL